MSGKGGVVRPDDILPNETREQYEARMAAKAQAADIASKDTENKQQEVVSLLQALQPKDQSRSSQVQTAVDNVKKPLIDAVSLQLGELFFGILNMDLSTFESEFRWVIDNDPRPGKSNQEKFDHFTTCVISLHKEAMGASINLLTAAPTALYRLGFNSNPLAVGAAIGTNVVFRYSGYRVLTMLSNNIIGSMTFYRLTLAQVTEAFHKVYTLTDPETFRNELKNLLLSFSVPEDNVDRYIDYMQSFTIDQLKTLLSTLLLTSVQFGFGTELAGEKMAEIIDLVTLNPNAGEDQINALGARIICNVPGPFRAITNFAILVLQFLRRSFIYACNSSTKVGIRTIFAMYGTVSFLRNQPGRGPMDRVVGLITAGANRVGQATVSVAQGVSPQDDPMREALLLLFSLIGLQLTGNRDDDLDRVAIYRHMHIRKMLKTLNDRLVAKSSNTRVEGLFLSDRDGLYLLDLIGEVDGFINMGNFMKICQSAAILKSLTEVDIEKLSKDFMAFSHRDDAMSSYNPTLDSLKIRAEVIGLMESDMWEQFRETGETMGVGTARVLSGMAVAGGISEDSRSPSDIRRINEIKERLTCHISAMKQNFIDELANDLRNGKITQEDYDEYLVKYSKYYDDIMPRMMSVLRTNLQGDSSAARVEAFLMECAEIASVVPLTEQVVKSKPVQVTIVFAKSCGSFLAGSLNSLKQGGIRLFTSGVRGLFGRAAAAAAAAPVLEEFNQVVDAVAARDDAAADAAAAAAAAAAPPAAAADPAAVSGALIALAHEAAAFENQDRADVDQDGDVIDRDGPVQGSGMHQGSGMDQGGGRSRKRSASKRTRRKAKKPSKKLKRKSRRYVRRRRSTRRKN